MATVVLFLLAGWALQGQPSCLQGHVKLWHSGCTAGSISLNGHVLHTDLQ